MGRTSATVKNRYNAKAYDRISLMVKSGNKDLIVSHAADNNESLNGFINRAIDETIERDKLKTGSKSNE